MVDAAERITGRHRASIVPPPFGSGYEAGVAQSEAEAVASIVPPPFRERLYDTPVAMTLSDLQASIVPPPFGSGYHHIQHRRRTLRRCFNRAAPFRERLYLRGHFLFLLRIASIVPPPFGSGYWWAPATPCI